jgi:hypothetical protein
MNNAAILPYIGMHALQIQNVKRNTVKKASINELNNINSESVEANVNSEYTNEDLVPKIVTNEIEVSENQVIEENTSGTEI